MFKTQNSYDEIVEKATDENLTSENWDLLLNVCEKVDKDIEKGSRDCIASIQKRLSHRNANVQLYALTLADTLVKNCGVKIHREICSRSFTTNLTRLLSDRTTHQDVKSKILQLIMQWTNDFRTDPSLGIMEETYNNLKSQNYTFPVPDKPQKKELSDEDRRKEEEELQEAIIRSMQDTGGRGGYQGFTGSSSSSGVPIESTSKWASSSFTISKSNNATDSLVSQLAKTSISSSQSQSELQSQPTSTVEKSSTPLPPVPNTIKPVSRVKALYDFTPTEPGELAFTRGDIITVLDAVYESWWRGEVRGRTGIFPVNYVEPVADPTPQDILREAEIEDHVFASGRNVDKLLQILSTIDPNHDTMSENDELQNLYHTVISIRPKLLNLIAKYTQKRNDLITLSKKFQDARQSYDELMERSIQKYGGEVDPYTNYNGVAPYSTGYYSTNQTFVNTAYPSSFPTNDPFGNDIQPTSQYAGFSPQEPYSYETEQGAVNVGPLTVTTQSQGVQKASQPYVGYSPQDQYPYRPETQSQDQYAYKSESQIPSKPSGSTPFQGQGQPSSSQQYVGYSSQDPYMYGPDTQATQPQQHPPSQGPVQHPPSQGPVQHSGGYSHPESAPYVQGSGPSGNPSQHGPPAQTMSSNQAPSTSQNQIPNSTSQGFY